MSAATAPVTVRVETIVASTTTEVASVTVDMPSTQVAMYLAMTLRAIADEIEDSNEVVGR